MNLGTLPHAIDDQGRQVSGDLAVSYPKKSDCRGQRLPPRWDRASACEPLRAGAKGCRGTESPSKRAGFTGCSIRQEGGACVTHHATAGHGQSWDALVGIVRQRFQGYRSTTSARSEPGETRGGHRCHAAFRRASIEGQRSRRRHGGASATMLRELQSISAADGEGRFYNRPPRAFQGRLPEELCARLLSTGYHIHSHSSWTALRVSCDHHPGSERLSTSRDGRVAPGLARCLPLPFAFTRVRGNLLWGQLTSDFSYPIQPRGDPPALDQGRGAPDHLRPFAYKN